MGWNGSSSAEQAERSADSKLPKARTVRGIVAGLAAVVVGALVLVSVRGGRILEEDREAGGKGASRVEDVGKRVPERADRADSSESAVLSGHTGLENFGQLTNEAGNAVSDDARLTSATRGVTVATNIFRSGTEQVLGKIFSTRLGDMPPPLPNLHMKERERLAEILIADNKVLPQDSEQIAFVKESCVEAKAALREYIKEGGDIDDFLAFYHGQLRQANDEWKDAQRSLSRIMKEEPEIALEYYNKLNDRLTKKGIKPLMVPHALKQHIDSIDSNNTNE